MYQVMHNQESTDRQYALQHKALQYGWDATRIRILDGDLGQSGSHTTNREDFKLLVAEVSMGNVGAIFVLEASRLSRSSADWNRLLELCSLTQTLIIDQDWLLRPQPVQRSTSFRVKRNDVPGRAASNKGPPVWRKTQ